jgi:hypothetical protein
MTFEVETWEGEAETEVELILSVALATLLRQNINEMRPNSGVVLNSNDEVYVVRYEASEDRIVITKHMSEDDPICDLPSGTMVVFEDGEIN